MADFINTIDALGDDVVMDSIINRSITEFKDDKVSNVGKYAFAQCQALTEVDVPAATKLWDAAFQYCTSLKTINAPLCTELGAQAFQYSGIESVSFPFVTLFGSSVFSQCKSLKSANFPAAPDVASNLFNNCSALVTVDFPIATIIRSNAFERCSSLTKLDFPLVSRINSGAFAYCTALKSLVLRNETVCTLDAVAILSTCPIADGTGYIYVPSALIESYKAAANWSTYANQFRNLEEWTVDNTVTGELIDDAANKHIVHFYNSDGTPLGYTIVAAGSDAVYSGADPVDPAGSGYPFGGFEPSPKNVTADMDCYATFKDAWDEVFASIADGTYKTKFALGDTVPLDLGSEGVVNMEIVAFDTDDLADGSGKAPITWISKELLATKHRYNPALVTNDDGTNQEGTGNVGGWGKCEIRTYLQNAIMPMIPNNVRSKIAAVTKHFAYRSDAGTKTNDSVSDYVWLPSYKECFNKTNAESNGVVYDYVVSNIETRKKCLVGSTLATTWLLRSASTSGYTQIFGVTDGGAGNYFSPASTLGIALCFCT